MNNHFKYKITLMLALVLTVSTGNLIAQQQALRVTVEPLNRVTVYFSNYPINYSSELSPDKRKVSITVRNSSVSDSARNKQSLGIVDNVYIQTSNKDIIISITMKDKRGYTAVPLPYSKALMIDVFNWEESSSTEDSYRSGLLAIESGINVKAKFDLLTASKANQPEASFFLGLINLNEGNFRQAAELFRLSLREKADIPDLFAAISQLYKIYNISDKSASYKDYFCMKSKIYSYSDMQIISKYFNDSADKNKAATLDILDDPIFTTALDSNNRAAASDTAKAGSQPKPAGKAAQGKPKPSENQIAGEIAKSLFPDWFLGAFSYIGFGIAVVLLFIFYSYIKWRKRQLKLRKKQPKERSQPKSQPKQASSKRLMTGSARLASDLYSKNEDTQGKKKPEPNKSPIQKPKEIIGESKEDFESALNNISETLSLKKSNSESRGDFQPIEPLDEIFEEKKSVRSHIPPKLELAMHLQEEQRNLKSGLTNKNIKPLAQPDPIKLAEVARKFGIEPEKTKLKSISGQFVSDDSIVARLTNKFSQDESSEKPEKM